MKKLTTTLVSLALATSVAMADKSLETSMSSMESGLNDIQKGFLYNQKSMILDGAKTIVEANKIFHSENSVKKYLPKNKAHMSGIALNTANRINQYSDELKLYINNSEYTKASQAYSDIISACTACHSIVRGW
jgi:cytochrome c553